MARRSLKPQLNQIRTWVRQGRTDAWIAHKLEVTVQQIDTFKRENDLLNDGPDGGVDFDDEIDLRASDDALIAAELEAEAASSVDEAPAAGDEDEDEDDDDRPRRRRGRRGGRARGRTRRDVFEATFDHGEEGYGLWLDPAVADSQVYAESWAGHRQIEVEIGAEQIVIKRVGDTAGDDE